MPKRKCPSFKDPTSRLIIICTLSMTPLMCYAHERPLNSAVGAIRPAFGIGARGGASSLPSEVEEEQASAEDSKEMNKDDDKVISISSLFRLNNEIKAQVSQFEEETAEGPVSPHNKGRGGALAVIKERPRLFGAFDTSAVSPMSSRLIQEDDEAKLAKVATTTTTDDAKSELASASRKLWWNTAWQQQFPDGEIEAIEVISEDVDFKDGQNTERERDISANDDGDKTEEVDDEEAIDELEGIVNAEKTQRGKRKVSTAESLLEAIPKIPETLVEKHDLKIVSTTNEVEGLEHIMAQSSNVTIAQTVRQKGPYRPYSPFESSGYWHTIDNLLTIGYASTHPNLRLSRRLRVMRKQVANITGLHGVVSGKGRNHGPQMVKREEFDEHMGIIRRRLAAIDRARGNLGIGERGREDSERGKRIFGERSESLASEYEKRFLFALQQEKERVEEDARRKRVQEIDSLISQGQERLLELVTEKDILQRRPNPLWNYTTALEDLDQVLQKQENGTETVAATIESITPSRQFNFPPPDLVEEYLTMLFSSSRLTKLNHTDLWKNGAFDEDDNEDDDEWLSPKDAVNDARNRKRDGKGSGGSRWLRNGLGEKLGETVETAAYRAVGGGVMSFLARSISSIHGINVMHHTDIRLFAEQAPLLPPAAGVIPGAMGSSSYAHGAFENALKRGSRKSKKRRKRRDESFIQRDAVVETLLSQCQIAMPLFKVFPLAWQRAMLGNIVTLITSIMMDFCEGLEFQILGHRLSFSFIPITEEDMMRHWASATSDGFKRRHANAARFEAAVRATANDVAVNLNFLDRWHERLLGADALKTQLSNLIARLVLTLVDETLSGARMDLWTTHAGGPKLIAGLEYRTNGVKQ